MWNYIKFLENKNNNKNNKIIAERIVRILSGSPEILAFCRIGLKVWRIYKRKADRKNPVRLIA